MKINIKFIYSLALLSLLLYSGCSKQNIADELFDNSTDQRIKQQKAALKNLLISSESGWKMLYFTKNDEFGGFAFLMKFNADNTVKMTSDVNRDTAVTTGKYTITLGSTLKLNFSTYNHIHKLTDSYTPAALRGQGYKGSAEFLYYGNSNDNMKFKSVRQVASEKIIFQKATEKDWDGLIAEAFENHNRLFSSNTYNSVYRGIRLSVNNSEDVYSFSFNKLKRYINISVKSSEGKNTNRSFGVGFAKNGFISSPELKLKNQIFTNFTWDVTSKKFISVNSNNAVAELLYLDAPVVISDDYLLINNNKGGGHIRFSFTVEEPYLIDTPYTSALFLDLFYKARQNFINTQRGKEFYRFYIQFTEGSDKGRVRYRYYSGTKSYSIYHKFTYSVINKKIVLHNNGWQDNNYTKSREEALAPIDKMLFNQKGFYIELLSETYNYSNPVYTFTSAEDTRIRFPSWSYN
ncbi:MAG: DUF4302 domain-containing protein [Tenacibaculum sp.]